MFDKSHSTYIIVMLWYGSNKDWMPGEDGRMCHKKNKMILYCIFSFIITETMQIPADDDHYIVSAIFTHILNKLTTIWSYSCLYTWTYLSLSHMNINCSLYCLGTLWIRFPFCALVSALYYIQCTVDSA